MADQKLHKSKGKGKQDETEFMVEIREKADAAWNYDKENRERGRDDLKHLAGDQWPEVEKQARIEEGRPCLTMNHLSQSVRTVTGDLRQNRPAIKVRPVDNEGDSKIADMYSGIIRNIEMRSKLRKPYITAGIAAASCGIGHFRIETDYVHVNTFDQDALITPIHNPFAVVWDPLARNSTRSDARYCFVNERIGREEFKAQWPKAKLTSWDEFTSEDTTADWYDENTVRIAEYWEKTPITKTIARTVDGQMHDITGMKEDELLDLQIEEQRDIQSHEVNMYLVSGVEILEGPTKWPTPDIPIIAVTGEETISDDKVTRVGVISHAKDAQRMYNYWNTANTEFVALAPKQPYIATMAQVGNYLNDWKNANKDNRALLLYKGDPQAPGAPQRQAPPMPSSGMITAMQFAADDIKATTGIHDASLGARGNETSGVAIEARQREGDVSTNFISDNLSAAVQQCGRILVDLIPIVYDTARTIRILHEDGSEEFQSINQPNMDIDGPEFLNDLSVGQYDVDVTTGPSYGTKRVEAADSMIGFIRAVPNAAPLIGDLIAKNMDWPGAEEIADRLRKTLPDGIVEGDDEDMTPEEQQKKQAQAELAQQQKQLQDTQIMLTMKELEAKIAKLQSETQDNAADTANTQADTAAKALELAIQTGQLEQVVRRQVAVEISQILSQDPTAPALGLNAFPQG